VQGYPTAHAPLVHRLFQAIRNENDGDSYLIEWRRRQIGDPHPDKQFVPYPLAKFTGEQCRYLRYLGRLGGVRTNPTLMGGKGSNAFWMTLGRTARDIEDVNHRFTTSGTLHLTELRRNPGVVRDLEAIEFETQDCTVTETVTPGITIDDVDQVSVSFEPIQTSGWRRINLAALDGTPDLSGRRIKPRFSFARGTDSSLSPKVLGPLRLFYRERPLLVRVFQLTFQLRGTPDVRSAQDQADRLQKLQGERAQRIDGLPIDFGRVERVEIQPARDTGGGETRRRGEQRVALVQIAGWSA
jgi:hypothetical protein